MAARPMWGTGIRERAQRAATGFTLIEVLVVVAITGIVIAVASVNFFPGDTEIARREAGQLALAIEHARDSAWFGGRPTAVSLDEGRLRTWRRTREGWSLDAARDRPLASGLRIVEIAISGRPSPIEEKIVFLPDGLGEPFRVALEVRGLPYAVDGDIVGAVTVAPR